MIIIITLKLSIIITHTNHPTVMNPIMLSALIEIENNNNEYDELAEIRQRSDGPTLILMAILFILFVISTQFNQIQ